MGDRLGDLRAFLDESCCLIGTAQQEYLVGAAIVESSVCDAVRDELRPLLLPGQIKLHWTDESRLRRRRIADVVAGLEAVNVIVSHVGERKSRTERFRRKCLEALYYEFGLMEIAEVTLECRSPKQDGDDRAHIVALQAQGLHPNIRLSHRRGGEEPLLWIADAVLGAINAARRGEGEYLDRLEGTVLLQRRISGLS